MDNRRTSSRGLVGKRCENDPLARVIITFSLTKPMVVDKTHDVCKCICCNLHSQCREQVGTTTA